MQALSILLVSLFLYVGINALSSTFIKILSCPALQGVPSTSFQELIVLKANRISDSHHFSWGPYVLILMLP